jgi:HAD superfamily hydrolase (TIGR01509 family)
VHWPSFWEEIPGHELFEDVLISADVGLVKPQPEIFRLACERFGISAGESVFIDDTPANAEAAYYVGMRAVVFHGDTAELRRELETVILESRV